MSFNLDNYGHTKDLNLGSRMSRTLSHQSIIQGLLSNSRLPRKTYPGLLAAARPFQASRGEQLDIPRREQCEVPCGMKFEVQK